MLTDLSVLSVSSGYAPAHSLDNSTIGHIINIDMIPSLDLALHSHTYYKLTYVCDCDPFSICIGGTKTSFKPGFIYLLPPDVLHTPANHYAGAITSWQINFLTFSKTLSRKIGDSAICVRCTDEMKMIFAEIIDTTKPSSGNCIRVNTQLTKLIEKILLSKDLEYIKNQADHDFVKLISFIYSHYNEDLTLSSLASVIHIEKTHFVRKFKEICGITPVNYLYSVRLFRSLDMLTFTNKSIETISQKVGFKRATAYSAAFKKAYGMTPREYRKRKKARLSAKFQQSTKTVQEKF